MQHLLYNYPANSIQLRNADLNLYKAIIEYFAEKPIIISIVPQSFQMLSQVHPEKTAFLKNNANISFAMQSFGNAAGIRTIDVIDTVLKWKDDLQQTLGREITDFVYSGMKFSAKLLVACENAGFKRVLMFKDLVLQPVFRFETDVEIVDMVRFRIKKDSNYHQLILDYDKYLPEIAAWNIEQDSPLLRDHGFESLKNKIVNINLI